RMGAAAGPAVRVLPPEGPPVAVGRPHHAPRLPRVMVYGPYGVQPAEPLELWHSPPFEPEVRDGKVYGRGACDDKAGVLTAMHAVEAYTATGAMPPLNVTFLIEGDRKSTRLNSSHVKI